MSLNLNLVQYSLGIVAVNKDKNNDLITVWPSQVLPTRDGETVDSLEDYQIQMVDSFGRSQSVAIKTSNVVTAKWYCQDPNRMTAPDVRRGAEVQLWHIPNTDYYYWSTTSNTKNYQKLETVEYAYSATQNEEAKPDKTNSYTQGVDTAGKFVNLLSTAKANGEKFKYDVNVDTGNSKVNIMDDIGNMFMIDSANQIVRLQTSAGAFIEINKRDITIGCDNLKVDASSSISETTQNRSLDASSGNTINTPATSHVGEFGVTGGISGVGGATGSGMKMTGDFEQIGSQTVSGDVVASGISLASHRHKENQSVTSSPI